GEVADHPAQIAVDPAPADVRAEPEVLPDGQLREGPTPFRDVRDTEPGGRFGAAAGDAPAAEPDLARAPDRARARAQGGGLAGDWISLDRRSCSSSSGALRTHSSSSGARLTSLIA